MSLCKYAIDKSDGINIVVDCSVTGNVCGMYRYCTEKRVPVMTDTFLKHGCLYAKEKNEVTKSVKQKTSKSGKKIICNVAYSKGNKTSVSAIVNGVSSSFFIEGNYHSQVEIEYSGKNFTYDNIVSITQL